MKKKTMENFQERLQIERGSKSFLLKWKSFAIINFRDNKIPDLFSDIIEGLSPKECINYIEDVINRQV